MSTARQVANFDPALFKADEVKSAWGTFQAEQEALRNPE